MPDLLPPTSTDAILNDEYISTNHSKDEEPRDSMMNEISNAPGTELDADAHTAPDASEAIKSGMSEHESISEGKSKNELMLTADCDVTLV